MTLPTQSAKRKAAIKSGEWKPKPRKAMKRTKMKTKRKPTGELQVFLAIWNQHEHKCEVCGVNIEEATASNFSHLLPKGSYPKMRLDMRNVRIKCDKCHTLWHQHGAEGLRYSHPWQDIIAMYDGLKQEYNQRLSAELSGKA